MLLVFCLLATSGTCVLRIAVTAAYVHVWLLQYLISKLHLEVLCFLWEVIAQVS